jgi:uncharacterized membrane protein (UPF0127 family)
VIPDDSHRGPRVPARVLAFALAGLLSLACRASAPAPGDAQVVVTIRDTPVHAELAADPARRAQGLSGRARLDPGSGMLFLFEEPGTHAFWMPDMHFDLDLVWIRGQRVVGVTRDVSRLDPIRQYEPPAPVDRVLEVPAGFAARHGWRRGDPVAFDPPLPDARAGP